MSALPGEPAEYDDENHLEEWALAYAKQLGWAVFPLAPGQKTPLTAHGFKDATTDEAKIRGWWKAHPAANIGIACGSVSGIVVLDEDPRNGGDVLPFSLPHTIQALTGGGGAHYF